MHVLISGSIQCNTIFTILNNSCSENRVLNYRVDQMVMCIGNVASLKIERIGFYWVN